MAGQELGENPEAQIYLRGLEQLADSGFGDIGFESAVSKEPLLRERSGAWRLFRVWAHMGIL